MTNNSFPDFLRQGYQVIRELGHNHHGGRITYLAVTVDIQMPEVPEESRSLVTQENQSLLSEQNQSVLTEGRRNENTEDYRNVNTEGCRSVHAEGRRSVYPERSRRVVIKHFQFHQPEASWSGYGAIEREIQVLQGLQHPGIPRYLDSFPTENGFCLVQEYKPAESLATPRSFAPEEIKQIAVGLLEILVYLQKRLPFVSHRDIKPENILVDEEMQVYLVDFGLAKVGQGEATTGTVAKGTLGFMAPEQLFNRQVTEASDLYSVGATLICLVTGTKSSEITNLIDDNYRLNFQHLVPQLSLRWLEWLEGMVALLPKYRYRNATEALAALKPIYVTRTPEVVCSEDTLEFTARKLGQKITKFFTIHNFVPETTLVGSLAVVSHPQDSLQPTPWIRLPYRELTGNRSMVKVTVDTRRLKADAVYERELELVSNASPEVQTIKIRVKTAPIPLPAKKLPISSLFLLVFFGVMAAWLEAIAWAGVIHKHGMIGLVMALFVTMIIALFGGLMAIAGHLLTKIIRKFRCQFKIRYPQIDEIAVFGLASLAAVSAAQFGSLFREQAVAIQALTVVDVAVFMTMFITGKVVEINRQQGFNQFISMLVTMLCLGLGISLGLGTKLGWSNLWVLGSIAATTTPLLGIFLYPPLERRYRLDRYRQSEHHLISP